MELSVIFNNTGDAYIQGHVPLEKMFQGILPGRLHQLLMNYRWNKKPLATPLTPTMGKETPDWGKADIQSFVHPSLMPVLVARAVSCLGHIKKKKVPRLTEVRPDQNYQGILVIRSILIFILGAPALAFSQHLLINDLE